MESIALSSWKSVNFLGVKKIQPWMIVQIMAINEILCFILLNGIDEVHDWLLIRGRES